MWSVGPIVLLSLPLLACANQDPEGAAKLWARLATREYRAMPRAPGNEARTRSEAIHAREVDIYVSQSIVDALAPGTPLPAWPEGALIVKDGWDGETLKLTAVMEKRAGAWYWAEYHDDGGVAASGAPAICVGCHRTGDDFVRAFQLP